MAYVKTTWVDEVLAGAERFAVKDNVGAAVDAFADLANCQIALATTVTTPGTPINAANLNNIENGIDAISKGAALSVKGVTGAAAGDVADIAAAVDGYVLRRSGAAVAFGQVVAAGIADNAVVAAKIATGAVTAGKIGAGGVSAAAQIADGIVSSAKLADAAVTAGKIATGGVSATGQIADGIVTNAKLADSFELIYLKVFWHDEDVIAGNGQLFFTVPPYLAGGVIVDFDISCYTASSSGLPTVQMANCGANPLAVGTDILSTRAFIDVNEFNSMSAATQPVIANPNLASGDILRIDVDVAGTGTKGLDVFFKVNKP